MLINGSRYALIRVLPGGIPNAVHPVSDLGDGRQKLKELLKRDGEGWHLFDLVDKKIVDESEASAAGA